MVSSLESRPSATTFDLEQLVEWTWRGSIRVPHFQRSFRWGWEDVRRLFDSIVRGYPVGSLLLWIRPAPAQRLQLGELIIDAPASEQAYWVVDGQQRIISLANALHDRGYAHANFALSYDLEAEKFVKPSRAERPTVVPLPVLFELTRLLRWFREHPGVEDYVDHADTVAKKIRQFGIPAYQVESDDEEVLQTIFDRMNSSGKKLSRAEVFSALHAGEEGEEGVSISLEGIASKIDASLNFGSLNSDTILQAILARRNHDVLRDVKNEFARQSELEGRDVAYDKGAEALERAVIFLQEDAKVPHVTLMAYRFLIVVLTRFFSYFPDPDPRSRRLLRRWYWRAAMVGPEVFKGGTSVAARTLSAQVQPGDPQTSIQGMLEVISHGGRKMPSFERFATNDAATKMLLCSWWALGPRSPETGEAYTLAELAGALEAETTAKLAVRYMLAPKSVPTEQRAWSANRILVPYLIEDTSDVSGRFVGTHIDIGKEAWERVLRSHQMGGPLVDLLNRGEVGLFLEERQRVITRSFEEFIDSMAEWDFEDTPPLTELVLDEEGDDELE